MGYGPAARKTRDRVKVISMSSSSQQIKPSQTPTRPLKRPYSSTIPTPNCVVPKKFCKQPDIKRKMSIPPIPPVQSEAALAIFVHSSLKSMAQNDNFGDADRLAFIGRNVLTMAVAEVLFEKKPMLGAVELEV
jgi:dsRNA-specific ribonuclease